MPVAISHIHPPIEHRGSRVVVDMSAPAVAALEALLAQGYGATQKEVVCNAVLEVAAKRVKKA